MDIDTELERGDRVRVEMRDGGIYDCEFVRVDAAAL